MKVGSIGQGLWSLEGKKFEWGVGEVARAGAVTCSQELD